MRFKEYILLEKSKKDKEESEYQKTFKKHLKAFKEKNKKALYARR